MGLDLDLICSPNHSNRSAPGIAISRRLLSHFRWHNLYWDYLHNRWSHLRWNYYLDICRISIASLRGYTNECIAGPGISSSRINEEKFFINKTILCYVNFIFSYQNNKSLYYYYISSTYLSPSLALMSQSFLHSLSLAASTVLTNTKSSATWKSENHHQHWLATTT